MKKTLLLLPLSFVAALTACSTAPKGDTFASRLMVQGGQAQSIAKKWVLAKIWLIKARI